MSHSVSEGVVGKPVGKEVKVRHIGNFLKADPDNGKGVADALGIPFSEVPKTWRLTAVMNAPKLCRSSLILMFKRGIYRWIVKVL